jgi:hypothetical protein
LFDEWLLDAAAFMAGLSALRAIGGLQILSHKIKKGSGELDNLLVRKPFASQLPVEATGYCTIPASIEGFIVGLGLHPISSCSSSESIAGSVPVADSPKNRFSPFARVPILN